MQVPDIRSLDLNLLTPLAVLLEERHVTRASSRAGMSQPAMSRALRRLRTVFADELLVRSAGAYELTPRAEQLRQRLRELLPQLQQLVVETPFDPSAAEQTFRLAGTDYTALILGPPLFRSIQRQSPRSRLFLSAWHDDVFDHAQRGRLDLIFYGMAPPGTLSYQHLFDEQFVCVMAADHPLAHRDRLTLEEYLGCSHVVVDVNQGEQSVIDRYLATLGTQRAVTLKVPYHAAASHALPGTSLLATLPRRLVASLVDREESLTSVDPPEQIETMRFLMAWDPRLDNDPAHRWLRDTVAAVTTKTLTPVGATPPPPHTITSSTPFR